MAIWADWAAGAKLEALAAKYDLERKTLENRQREWRDGVEPLRAVRTALVKEFSFIAARAAASIGVSNETLLRQFRSKNRAEQEAAEGAVAAVIREMGVPARVAEMKVRRYRLAIGNDRLARAWHEMAYPPKLREESELSAYTRTSAESPESLLLEREERGA